jgi:hypothetical protein
MPELTAGSGISLTRSGGILTIAATGGGGGAGEALALADHGVVADGSTVNSASAVTSLISGLSRSTTIMFPNGEVLFDDDIEFDDFPVNIDAYGSSSHTTGTDGGTILTFPPGKAGLVFLPGASGPGGQRSKVANLTINATSRLATTCTVNFTAGNNYCDITGGTNDYTAKMVIGINGAGPNFTPIGKTATTTVGSNVVAINSVMGNPGVYVDQPITIPGAGAGGADLVGFVGAWAPSSITIVNAAGAALNAGTAVTDVSYTIKLPLISRIKTVSGSRLTFDQTPSNVQSVTGAKARHAAPGIYSSVTIDTEHVQTTGNMQVGIALVGESGEGNADNGNHYASEFVAEWVGGYARGFDAQINNFNGCNFAGAKIQFLDCSLIGNHFDSCHFAFNVGYVGALASQFSTFSKTYVEGGTSMMGVDTQFAFGGEGWVNGSGINFIGQTSDPGHGTFPSISTPALTVLGLSGGSAGGARITGPAYFASSAYCMSIGNRFSAYPAAVAGIRYNLGQDLSRFIAECWDHTANAHADIRHTFATKEEAPGGSVVGTWASYGLGLAAGKVLKVNGTQVVADRFTKPGTPALADVIACLDHHGLWG